MSLMSLNQKNGSKSCRGTSVAADFVSFGPKVPCGSNPVRVKEK
jgi:hypothetical protein